MWFTAAEAFWAQFFNFLTSQTAYRRMIKLVLKEAEGLVSYNYS